MSEKLIGTHRPDRYLVRFLFVLLATSCSVSATDCSVAGSCRIAVSFTGTFLGRTCEVDVNNGGTAGTVNLPAVSAKSLQKSGAEVGSTPFPIALRNCPVNRTIEMRFTTRGGDASDTVTKNLINGTGNDFSRDVQVRVRNIAGTQMRIDDNTSYQEYVIPANGNEVTQYFIASYYAKSNGAVNAGRVQTRSTIDLTYK